MNTRRVVFGGWIAVAVLLLTGCDPNKRGGMRDGAADSSDANHVKLRLRLEKGATYRMRMTMDQALTQTIMGQAQDMKQLFSTSFSVTVREIGEDGTYSLVYRYEKLRFRQSGPMVEMEYDSEKPDEVVHPMAWAFAALVGQEFTARMKPTGEVVEVGGLEVLIDALLKEVPAMPSVAEQFREQFGDESMKQMIQQASIIFPEKPVAVGDDWSTENVISKGFPFIMSNDWTLASIEDDVVRLGVASQMSPNPDGKPLQMGGMTMSYLLSGDQVGMLMVDRQTGWIVGGEMTQMLEGEIRLGGMPGRDGEMKWPMKAKSKVTFERY